MSLDILLLSDIGANPHFLDKLIEAESRNTYDFVFFVGGAGEAANEIGHPVDPEQELDAIRTHDEAIEKLEKLLSRTNERSKVLFVPSNTDA